MRRKPLVTTAPVSTVGAVLALLPPTAVAHLASGMSRGNRGWVADHDADLLPSGDSGSG
jgi:hypothetical protein